MNLSRIRRRTCLALLCLTWAWLAQARGAHAQAPAAQPPPPGYPAQPAPAYPPQQAYPQQQAYPPPQQAYPQQAYPQQAYPQQAYPAQPYQQPQYQQPVRRPRPRRGMLSAGIAVLSASYGVALISGAILVDSDCCSEAGAMLMIPVVGPFLAINDTENGKGLLALLGTVEIVGVGLLIGGIARYVTSKRAAENQGYYSWQLPHDRSLGVALNTSPAALGPQLKLRF